MLDNQRRRPARRLIALLSPFFGARQLVECGDEIFAFMVPVHDDLIAVERGGAAFAKAVARALLAEVFFPDAFAGHVIAVEAARTEVGPDMGAVCDRRMRGKAVVFVMALVWRQLASGLLPEG